MADYIQNRIQFNEEDVQSTIEIFQALQMAITKCQLVEIEYTSLSDETTDRLVEPFAFYSTKENWVLVAYCRLRTTFRKFRIDRIQSIKVLRDKFDAHNLTMEEFFQKY